MECEQLIRLIKDWYLRVSQETMAPARMMQFVDQHVKRCAICRADLLLSDEVEKIRDFIQPDARLARIGRPGDDSTPEISDGPEEFESEEEFVEDQEESPEEEEFDEDLNEDDII